MCPRLLLMCPRLLLPTQLVFPRSRAAYSDALRDRDPRRTKHACRGRVQGTHSNHPVRAVSPRTHAYSSNVCPRVLPHTRELGTHINDRDRDVSQRTRSSVMCPRVLAHVSPRTRTCVPAYSHMCPRVLAHVSPRTRTCVPAYSDALRDRDPRRT